MKYEIVYGRCVATRDFGDVSKGAVGGFVEPGCLSQKGNCWVADDARVRGNARVRDNARVSGNAIVRDNAFVSGDAFVHGNAIVSGNAFVHGNAIVSGNAIVRCNAIVNSARVTGIADSGHIDRDLTGEAVVISGLGWLVTITDDHIKIGCACKSKKWWSEARDFDISVLHSKALAFWKINKPIILGLCR